MKRLRFVLALAFLAAAAITEVRPAPALAQQAECKFNPGDICAWHCTESCEEGCCGDWLRYAWTSPEPE